MKGLCAARKAAGYTQVQLADRLGVAQPTIAMWETGKAYPRTDIKHTKR